MKGKDGIYTMSNGEPYKVPLDGGFFFLCCDCGLRHFVLLERGVLRMWRDEIGSEAIPIWEMEERRRKRRQKLSRKAKLGQRARSSGARTKPAKGRSSS